MNDLATSRSPSGLPPALKGDANNLAKLATSRMARTTDRPYPSCLILHLEPEPVHVVAAADPVARICHVITAYRPDLEHFEPDFRTRRKGS